MISSGHHRFGPFWGLFFYSQLYFRVFLRSMYKKKYCLGNQIHKLIQLRKGTDHKKSLLLNVHMTNK